MLHLLTVNSTSLGFPQAVLECWRTREGGQLRYSNNPIIGIDHKSGRSQVVGTEIEETPGKEAGTQKSKTMGIQRECHWSRLRV